MKAKIIRPNPELQFQKGRRKVDQSAFFAVVQFKYKHPKNGERVPFTNEEIQAGENQKYIPGYDWIYGHKKQQIRNHESGLKKMYTFIEERCAGNFIKAEIRSCYGLPSGQDILIDQWIHSHYQLQPRKEAKYQPQFYKPNGGDDLIIQYFELAGKAPKVQVGAYDEKLAELVEKYNANSQKITI